MAKLGLVHYNFPGTLGVFLDYAARTGFKYAELIAEDIWPKGMDYQGALENAGRIKGILDDLGLKASAVSAQNDFLVMGEEEMAFQVERLEKVGRLAEILGTRILRVDGGWAKEGIAKEQWKDLMIEGFGRSSRFTEAHGFFLALDNHGLVTNDADLQLAIFDAVGSKNLGANLDTMNYRWAGHPLKTINEFYEKIAPHVFHVHMKDGRNSFADYEGTALGEGEIDLEWAVECLKKVGYQGPWCVEYEGRTDPEEGYRKGLLWLQRHLK